MTDRLTLYTTPFPNGTIEQKLISEFQEHENVVFREIMDTREAEIRKALVQLGWTPPAGDEDRINTPAEMQRVAVDHVVKMARKAVENFMLQGGFALIPLRHALQTLDILIGDVDKL